MKVLLLGDLHFGHRNGDNETAQYQIKVFDDFIFPLIKKHNIKRVIQFGDFFDSRKAIRHDTMELVRRHIIPKTENQEWDVIVGNHDMHRRDFIFPNSAQELLHPYPNFKIHNHPETVVIDGVSFDLIPWICRDNRREILEFIQNSTSKICIGHFELAGFEFYKGIESSGESSDFLSNYTQVWSGHFHTSSKKGHIQYIGTPYQLTFGDADDDRGVWIYDTTTGNLEFISNDMPRFSRIYFDADTFDTKNISKYAGMHIKLTVKNRGDAKKFEKFIADLAGVVAELDIIDRIDVSDTTANNKTNGSFRTVNQIVDEYIDSLEETEADRKKIKLIMTRLLSDSEK